MPPIPPDSSPEGGPAPTGPPEQPKADSLTDLLQGLRAELMTGVHARLHVVALEYRQASINFMQMLMLATLAALMLCGAWGTMLAGLYMACTALGLHWGAVMLMLMALNVAGAALIWRWAHSLSVAISFPATRRMLKDLSHGKAESSQP